MCRVILYLQRHKDGGKHRYINSVNVMLVLGLAVLLVADQHAFYLLFNIRANSVPAPPFKVSSSYSLQPEGF